METSALDSTNVEAAFNEVLSGRCLLPRVLTPPPPSTGGLFDSPAASHDLQPSKRRWPAGRWPAAPSAPWPCPAPSEPLTPRRGRGAAARAPNRPLPWYGAVTSKDESHMVSSRNYFTGKINFNHIAAQNALCTGSSGSDPVLEGRNPAGICGLSGTHHFPHFPFWNYFLPSKTRNSAGFGPSRFRSGHRRVGWILEKAVFLARTEPYS